MRLRGYSWADVLFTHPAGAVGQIVDIPDELAPLDSSALTGED
jgi:arabinose-5-phosphate isomerase